MDTNQRRYRQIVYRFDGNGLAQQFFESEEGWKLALAWLAEQQRLTLPFANPASMITIEVR